MRTALNRLAIVAAIACLYAVLPLTGPWAWAGSDTLTEAIEVQRREVAGRPEDPAAWNDYGNLLLLAGQEGAALEAYQQALDLDPERVSSHYNLALLHHRWGKLSTALEHYETAVELDPSHAWAHYQRGRVHETNGQREAAINAYAIAFGLDPSLTFADVNPYVIDNRLLTQALLRVGRDSRSDWAPRDYEEPGRITDLLSPPPPTDPSDPTAQEGATSTSDGGGQPRGGGAPPGSGGNPSSGRSSGQSTDPSPDASRPPAGASVGQDRVRGSANLDSPRTIDLDDSRQVDPRGYRATAPPPRRDAAPAPSPGGTRSQGSGVRAAPERQPQSEPETRSRFRPGPRSSAQLVPRLLPAAALAAG